MAEDSATRSAAAADSRTSLMKDQQDNPTYSTINPDADPDDAPPSGDDADLERRLRRKVDLRLCSIAGLLCSLNLLDSGVISSASVTSMVTDLDLTGNRYSVSIFIFTIASIVFQLPSTIAVRKFGPRTWFAFITTSFGLITLGTAFIHSWKEMIALRILLGMAMSGIYPGLTYLISTWYTKREMQVRYAFLQSGQVIVLATGSIVNYGLNGLDGKGGLAGWRYMFLVQGLITILIGLATYVWIVDFPEHAHNTPFFLTPPERALAISRIQRDRADVHPEPFHWRDAADPKLPAFATLFFLQNTVSTALAYFLPRILQHGLHLRPSSARAILLAAPPYYYAVLPVLLTSALSDCYALRTPTIAFNCACLIAGFGMLGFSTHASVRYAGVFLATGAYVSNWAALSAFVQGNICGQGKRAFAAAVVSMANGAGGVAGAFVVRPAEEAQGYPTAVGMGIGSHVLMVGVVGGLAAWFVVANRRQRAGRVVLEGREGFRYSS